MICSFHLLVSLACVNVQRMRKRTPTKRNYLFWQVWVLCIVQQSRGEVEELVVSSLSDVKDGSLKRREPLIHCRPEQGQVGPLVSIGFLADKPAV